MKKLLSFLLVVFPLLAFSQSFVFCPKIDTEKRQGLQKANISIVIKDSRVFEKDLKEKCKSTEVFSEFVSMIQQTYPNAKITVLNVDDFNIVPAIGIMTIKIDFQKYDVTFYSGMWIAKTKYEVQIFDYTNVKNVFMETILGEAKQFNVLGNSSGKTASNNSFERAFQEFILLIEKVSESTNIQLNNVLTPISTSVNSKNKTERLRELKQLLDEKILTQDEFDKEKSKILNDVN